MYIHHRLRYIGKLLCNAPLVSTRQAQPYRFKVRARNGLGWSEFGPPTPPVVLNPLRPCDAPELVDRGVTWLALKLRAPPGAGLLLGFEMHMYVGGRIARDVVLCDAILLCNMPAGSGQFTAATR